LGKITVIKTLLISKITHLFITLPDPPKEFMHSLNILLYEFLWDGKRGKIKKSVVCKSLEEGGFNMLNVHDFLTSMKCTWMRKLFSRASWVRTFVLNMYPQMEFLENYGSEFLNVLMSKMNNPFWKDVLKHYKKIYIKCVPLNIDHFMAECIHYNINIKRDKKTVHIQD